MAQLRMDQLYKDNPVMQGHSSCTGHFSGRYQGPRWPQAARWAQCTYMTSTSSQVDRRQVHPSRPDTLPPRKSLTESGVVLRPNPVNDEPKAGRRALRLGLQSHYVQTYDKRSPYLPGVCSHRICLGMLRELYVYRDFDPHSSVVDISTVIYPTRLCDICDLKTSWKDWLPGYLPMKLMSIRVMNRGLGQYIVQQVGETCRSSNCCWVTMPRSTLKADISQMRCRRHHLMATR